MPGLEYVFYVLTSATCFILSLWTSTNYNRLLLSLHEQCHIGHWLFLIYLSFQCISCEFTSNLYWHVLLTFYCGRYFFMTSTSVLREILNQLWIIFTLQFMWNSHVLNSLYKCTPSRFLTLAFKYSSFGSNGKVSG